MMYENNNDTCVANIKIIGVGGGGGNAVNRMIDSGIKNVEFIAVNTDRQALMRSKAEKRIQIGSQLTGGLGAGSIPDMGQKAAEESRQQLSDAIDGADLLFIAAGMGGGTGTGAAPIIAKLAKEKGILTVAVVTKPFDYEGKIRMKNANMGIEQLKASVDTIVVVPNQKLIEVLDKSVSLPDALKCADEMLRRGICSIVDIIATNSDINLDFADIRTVLKDKGVAHMGIGRARGENRAIDAVKAAVQSPLLETTIEGAKNVILSIVSSNDISMGEVNAIASSVSSIIDENASFIYGQTFDDKMGDELKITIIASDFTGGKSERTVDAEEEFETLEEQAPVIKPVDIYERKVPKEEPITTSFVDDSFISNRSDNKEEKHQKAVIPQFMRNLFGKK